jgi:hypothetical protein
MQDRICQVDETLLQRAAGPYIWVMSAGRRGSRLLLVLRNEPTIEDATLDFAFGPIPLKKSAVIRCICASADAAERLYWPFMRA